LKYLIIIPARGGSKGIPGKNLVKLRNIPLINHTIREALRVTALKSGVHAIVSTDDAEIRKVSLDSGIDVPFLRPSLLAGDHSPSIEYVRHAVDFYSRHGDCPENVMLLQPTSPLRTAQDVLSAMELFDDGGHDSLISVYQDDYINDKVMYTLNGTLGIPVSSMHNAGLRRQDDSPVLIRNGAIYITKVDYLRENGHIISRIPLVHMMPKSRSINIDTLEDLYMVEQLLK
jgi:CMP-N,N'-diacetyllegionaminic acid synthase